MGVDIILPVYNGSRWLDACLSSVLDQTYGDWNLTIVDDGSTDDSVEKVRAYCAREPARIDVVLHSQTRRAAGCRMEAIRQTSSDLIAFIDQDDRWLPRKLEKQVNRMASEPEVKAVHTDVAHIDECGRPIPGGADSENAQRAAISYHTLSLEELSASLFERNSIRLVSALVDRSAFLDAGGFEETLFGGEDWEFWVRFSRRWRIAHLPQVLVERRIHAMNTSGSQALERTHGLLEALALAESRFESLRPLARDRRSRLLERLILQALLHGEPSTARRGAWQMLVRGTRRSVDLACIGLGGAGPLGRWLVRSYRNRSLRRLLGLPPVD